MVKHIKIRKWVITTQKAKYLVYGDYFLSKHYDKSWNAINFFVKDIWRATRFRGEGEAVHAIKIMNIYLNDSIQLRAMEIWE